MKYVEMSGRKLTKYFKKEKSLNVCHRAECGVCQNSDKKRPSMCQVKGVVYSAVCLDCEKEYVEGNSERHNGVYIGETARTLSERSGEHRSGYRRMDFSNFMFKHWSNKHSDSDTPPEFRFSVLRKHPDPMGDLSMNPSKYLTLQHSTQKTNGGVIKSPDCLLKRLTDN